LENAGSTEWLFSDNCFFFLNRSCDMLTRFCVSESLWQWLGLHWTYPLPEVKMYTGLEIGVDMSRCHLLGSRAFILSKLSEDIIIPSNNTCRDNCTSQNYNNFLLICVDHFPRLICWSWSIYLVLKSISNPHWAQHFRNFLCSHL
jgi:hypothetical protein